MARILVVDDEVEFVGIMRKILTNARHEVITAYNIVEMGQKLIESLPHMIFLDVMMPEIDGWTASELLKSDEKYKDIPICMLTAKSSTLDAVTSLEEAKANWHLNKPVSKKQILETVDMLLSGKTDRIE
jgi:CheY-like chemotaxis protein